MKKMQATILGYTASVDVPVSKDVGGEVQETQTKIRGIEGVTAVRTVGDATDVGTAQVATMRLSLNFR